MMFSLVPAWRVPTVTTAVAPGSMPRDTMVWSFITVEAAMTTGSTVVWGDEPWPPWPCRVIFRASLAAMIGPDRWRTVPAGDGTTCWPRATVGVPNRS